jgi:uncharacterized protein
MKSEIFKEVLDTLEELGSDEFSSKSIKIRLQKISQDLTCEGCSTSIMVDRTLQKLDDLNEDTNIPTHIKTRLWDIVCKLESIPQ